jgi:hypothetical protein
MVVVAGGGRIVNVELAEVPPPGAGFVTVTGIVPAEAMLEAEIVAAREDEET